MSEQAYTVTTVCTHFPKEDYYCLNEFAKSLQMESILVLDAHYVQYAGLASKPKGLYKAITERLIDKPYIIFTDCFDFVFAESPRTLFRNFLSEYPDADIVISSEKNCFPADLKDDYDKLSDKPYRYLNSGMVVGKTEAILECLKAMDLANVPDDHWDAEKNCQVNPNDQFLWQEIFLKQPVKIELDYDQKLCCTLHQTTLDDLDFTYSRIRNKITDSMPLSWHFNGSAKSDGLRNPILQHLNLI